MSEFEDSLRARLRPDTGQEPAAPDTAFTAYVARRVEEERKGRAVGLTLATLAAVALAGGMTAGLATLSPVWSALLPAGVSILPEQALSLLGVVGPTFGVLVIAAILAPLAQSRR